MWNSLPENTIESPTVKCLKEESINIGRSMKSNLTSEKYQATDAAMLLTNLKEENEVFCVL